MEPNNGPVMLAATAVLRGQKTRIGKIGGNITLPRTVPLESLVAGGVGALLGLFIGAILNPSLDGFLYGTVFGAGAGVFLVSYSPLQGESMLTWLNLAVSARRNRVTIDGKPVRLAIGICYITRAAAGEVRVVRGAIPVPASQYDERGVPIMAKNRNLPEDLDFVPVRSKDFVKGASLPDNSPDPVTSKKGKKVLEKDKTAKKERPRRLIPGQAPVATQLGAFDPSAAALQAPTGHDEVNNPFDGVSFPLASSSEVQPWGPDPDEYQDEQPTFPVPSAPLPSTPVQSVPVQSVPVQGHPGVPASVGAPTNVQPDAIPVGNFAARRAAQRAAAPTTSADPLTSKPKKLPKDKKSR